MRVRKVKVADLFCGAGGTSTGAVEACEELGIQLELTAVNHWDKAIETHTANHPGAEHHLTNLDLADPRELVEMGKLDLLVASPECTHFSTARGGRPVNDQSRATAWCVIRWAEAVLPKAILVENVPEFLKWGPLKRKRVNGKMEWVPDPKRRGQTFLSWVSNLESLGYRVQWRKLIAADHGDPTSRERLFIQARRDRKPIRWPDPTHAPKEVINNAPPLLSHFQSLKPHRVAREIIDWSIKGKSIFGRKKPLSPNTLRKIYAGLNKFSGLPFIVPQLSGGAPRTVDRALQTITSTSRGIGLCEPFIIQMRKNQDAISLDKPLTAICTSGAHHALCEPFIIPFFGERDGQEPRLHTLDSPLPTVTARGAGALIEPFIIPINHGKDDNRTHSIENPMPTITSVDAWALIEPFIINSGGPNIEAREVGRPLNTVLSREHLALVQPYLIKYNGTGGALSVDHPLDTVTVKDRFALVIPDLREECGFFLLDILYRMLVPHELAAAMSFPIGYVFSGNREQKVKQIGNAVPVKLAKALIMTILSEVCDGQYDDRGIPRAGKIREAKQVSRKANNGRRNLVSVGARSQPLRRASHARARGRNTKLAKAS